MRRLLPLLAVLLGAPAARADNVPDLDFVAPLTVEAGAVISPGRAVAPSTCVFGSLGVGGGEWSVGRAEYAEIFGRLVAGGAWSPEGFKRLELGGSMVVLETNSIRTVVPPAIDEWANEVDLGELRIDISVLAWAQDMTSKSMQLGLRPYVRLTLPTDTSRWNEGRRASPLRRVLGDDIRDHAFVLTDVGAAFAWRWKLLNLYETVGMIFGAVVDADFQFLLSSTTGVAVDIEPIGLEIVLELNYLGRLTEAPAGAGLMQALAVSPGVRWRTGDLTLGVEFRAGLTGNDSAAAYGVATGGVTARYDL